MNRIPIEPSFAAWRRAARELLRQGVEPKLIEWIEVEGEAAVSNGSDAGQEARLRMAADAIGAASAVHVAGAVHAVGATRTSGNANTDNVDTNSANTTNTDSATPANTTDTPALATPAIPRDLLARLKTAACVRAADRWALLYRILWRWTRGERHVVELQDPDGALLAQRVQSVERETEDLLSLTLFRRRDPSMGPPEFVGWYEPHHDLLERAAARFAPRMGDSTWVLATPQGAAFWNGMLLRIGQPATEESAQATQALPPGAMAGEAPTSEPTEALWLAYYASVFNGGPAPVPLRYWRTPPAGPPLPARIARERSRLGARSATVTIAQTPPVEYSATTPPLREPNGPLATCRRCALWRNAKQAVAGVGPAHATLMAVGEQPGEYENQRGEPFAGVAGELLDTVLARAGVDRATLYLTYAVKHYKWETLDQQRVHRTPARREAEACQYWLEQELTQVAPRVVVTLGATALKALTGAHVNLSEYLGQTIAHRGRLIVPTWHPSYALRTADARLREDIVATIVTAFSRAAALAAERA
ncbi:Uracil-DNA glycosylase family domain protein [Paraburkholderia ribeironis]|uniref:Type-4 uracil-DNA glycosylase n=1 Tax=Paraburkholderia ribeironis TaxID=1247936 RepID=A0A1N7RIP4_9BURK|nr:UdgX family uracil-DNA binding protein [Paraburkholderia ribeironis]SIT34955.1 Uracil-DNA glycosylase family domain protein [Paraburkholderia ribeironis]